MTYFTPILTMLLPLISFLFISFYVNFRNYKDYEESSKNIIVTWYWNSLILGICIDVFNFIYGLI